MERFDVAVVGGGIGGLSAALELARAGRRVVVLERAAHPGGRARTQKKQGFSWNLGPHALYNGGAAAASLKRLGIQVTGGVPAGKGLMLREGALHLLPGSPLDFARTTLLPGLSRWDLSKAVLAIKAGPLPGPDVTLAEWLAPYAPPAADTILGLVRVSSYANAPEILSATAAVRQVRLALRGVRYLDGGWQTLVDGLTSALVAAGVLVRASADVVALTDVGEGHALSLADGSRLLASHVVLAVPPAAAAKLGVDLPPLTPSRVACLDLGLREVPAGAPALVFGADRPLYLSNHSAVARLADQGAVVHLMRYLAPGDDGHDAEAELESLLDLAWAGWRERVVARRFQPALIASHALPEAGKRRPAPSLGGGLWLVGDWVGDGAILADASFASATAAVRGILSEKQEARAA